jgi:hypothetical protein
VSKSKRTRARGWVLKRGQREGEVVGQGCHLGWFAKREKKNKRRRRKGSFGRNSFEFQKIQNLVQVVVVIC